MKLLKCKACFGEMDIIGNEFAVNKKVKCKKCKFSNENSENEKPIDVVILRKNKYDE